MPDGLQFGFPVAVADGRPTIVEGLDVGTHQRRLLDATIAELVDERDLALRLAR